MDEAYILAKLEEFMIKNLWVLTPEKENKRELNEAILMVLIELGRLRIEQALDRSIAESWAELNKG